MQHLLRSATNLRRSSGIVSSQRGFVISTERKGINAPLISSPDLLLIAEVFCIGAQKRA